jgi:hypothetical protein
MATADVVIMSFRLSLLRAASRDVLSGLKPSPQIKGTQHNEMFIQFNKLMLCRSSDRLCGLVVRSRGPGFDSWHYQIF